MNLVVDSNIIFSALISLNGKTAELLFKKDLGLFAPEMLIEELAKYQDLIISKSKVTIEEFELIKLFLFSKLTFVRNDELLVFFEVADKICPDKDDVAFFALCLAKEIPLWSNDKILKNQNVVKVLNTSEILKMLS